MASELAQTFLTTGADYERFRPGFPEAAVAVVVPGRVGSALDLGAGTGKLTEQLVHCADRVTAVDPSALMLAELRRKLPEVQAIEAAAEAIPLPSGSQEVVVVAQAFTGSTASRPARRSRASLPRAGDSVCCGTVRSPSARGTARVTRSRIPARDQLILEPHLSLRRRQASAS